LANLSFNLKQELHCLVDLLKGLSQRKEIIFHSFIDDNLPQYVKGDSIRIQQVIINLVNNAFKFTPKGGHVNIEVLLGWQRDSSVRIDFHIHDTGIGIPEDCRGSLFRPFFQCKSEHSRQGSGLGLYICNHLVSLMGGSITFKSEENIGTVFSRFVILQTSESSNTKSTKVELQKNFKKGKILVVEDNAINVKLITRHLKNFGMDFAVAENGKIAVDMYQNFQDFSIILMDIEMPVMNGLEATKQIRAFENKTNRRVPIVAVTAGVMEGELLGARAAGIDDTLAKPIKKEQLMNILEK